MACPACFNGFAHAGEPTGSETTLGDLPAYFAPSVGPAKGVILYLTDVFGHKFVNHRLLADTYSAAGFDVYVPDILQGAPVPADKLAFVDEDSSGLLASVGRGCRMLGILPRMASFLWSHREAATLPIVQAAAQSARAKADEKGMQLGVVGFCFGGRYAMKLTELGFPRGPADCDKDPPRCLVDVAVACHPSLVTRADIAAVGRPLLFCTPEHDNLMNAAAAAKAVETINGNAGGRILASFVVYKGQEHGFSVRGPPASQEARAKCAQDVTAFLTEKFASSSIK
jgi:dienelactone hydrolase